MILYFRSYSKTNKPSLLPLKRKLMKNARYIAKFIAPVTSGMITETLFFASAESDQSDEQDQPAYTINELHIITKSSTKNYTYN